MSISNRYRFYKSDSIEFILVNNTPVNFGEHCHTSGFVITIMLSGSAVIKKGNTERRIYPDDIFVINPYETHSLISVNEANIILISMYIKKQAVYELNENDYRKCISNALSEISRIIEFNKKRLNIFRRSAYEIYKKHHGNAPAAANIFEIGRNKIETQPDGNETAEQLAAEIFTSKYHYIRKFKEVAGLSPHKFRIQSRIRKSQRLLLSGDLRQYRTKTAFQALHAICLSIFRHLAQKSLVIREYDYGIFIQSDEKLNFVSYAQSLCGIALITNIALDAGFYDQSHFDRYFRKIVGISPTEYLCSVSNFLQAEN